ncbi:MAG TPA: protein-glutamate O-methyltransferase CheR [Mobilitalea sp.]|nr:protein-glutamate O-methyltransferase CheR [Mobilitalea sp.]
MIKITKSEFAQLAEFIKKNYGIQLKEGKQALVTSRLHYELVNNNCKNFTQYYEYILSDKTGGAITALIDRITTNHTYFMREADHFYYFRDKVLPYLSTSVKNKDLRIWSAGCSTGQEPYTLAMIINDYFKEDKKLWDSKILATDISSKVLKEAETGIYTEEEIKHLPAIWKLNYFKKLENGDYKVTDEIRKEVIFRKFNLMERIFPFNRKFHTIFCRNVMIYFDDDTKDELINKFYNSLEYGGYLFIGHTESIPRSKTGFQYIMPSVYRKV